MVVIKQAKKKRVQCHNMKIGQIGIIVASPIENNLDSIVQYVGTVGSGFLWITIGGGKGEFWFITGGESPGFDVVLLEDEEILSVYNSANDDNRTYAESNWGVTEDINEYKSRKRLGDN